MKALRRGQKPLEFRAERIFSYNIFGLSVPEGLIENFYTDRQGPPGDKIEGQLQIGQANMPHECPNSPLATQLPLSPRAK
jgi:hypothetical protein